MSDWSQTDYGMLASALAALTADAQTTARAQAEGGTEHNPLLGTHPSKEKINQYFLLSALTTAGIANALKPEFRSPTLGAWAGFEAELARENKTNDYHPNTLKRYAKPLAAALAGALVGHAINKGALSLMPTEGNGVALNYTRKF